MENRYTLFDSDERPSDSPYIDSIWRTDSYGVGGQFISIAEARWSMVITQTNGITTLSIHGAETHAKPAPIPKDAQFLGIEFNLGAFMPHLSPHQLVNNEITLLSDNHRTVQLCNAIYELPTYDNADCFIDRLVREGLLMFDELVPATLQGQPQHLTTRSVQRRFLRATGLTHGAVYQIRRANEAFWLLTEGIPILDTVELLGYADQPHLTRALKRFFGQTPAQLLRK